MSALNSSSLGVEVENHIDVPIAINVFQAEVHGTGLAASWTEPHYALVDRRDIKPVSRQDGHWYCGSLRMPCR